VYNGAKPHFQPIGKVSNAPSKAVKCNDISGGQTEIPVAAIKTAVKLAQQGPLEPGDNAVKFPHIFNNREVRRGSWLFSCRELT
jgi:hypothetical protein